MKELRNYLEQDTVAQVGYRPPVAVEPGATVAQALEIMQRERVGCILVVEERKLLGIFTERDLLRILGRGESLEKPIREVMTPEPVSVRKGDPISVVLSRMSSGGFRHLPVLGRSGKLIGTISIKRVVRFLADHFAQTVYNLPPEPDMFGGAREGA